MSITLDQIWSAPHQDLKIVLQNRGLEMKNGLAWDRVAVAYIYQAHGILVESDSIWVTYSAFLETMIRAPIWARGIQSLWTPCISQLLLSSIIGNAVVDAVVVVIDYIERNRCPHEMKDTPREVERIAWRVAGGNIMGFLRDSLEDITIYYADITIYSVVQQCAIDAVIRTVAPLQGVSPKVVGHAAAKAAWRAAAELGAKGGIPQIKIPETLFRFVKDPVALMRKLLDKGLPKEMDLLGKCIYLSYLRAGLGAIPNVKSCHKDFIDLVALHDCTAKLL